METIGDLIDKQSILMIRRAVAQDPGTVSVLDRAIRKNRDHLNQFYYEISAGIITEKDMVVTPKLKNYANQNNDAIPSDIKLGIAIERLVSANITIWDLEDKRRDKSLSDNERLEAADQVSSYNKERNLAIDDINSIVWLASEPARGKVESLPERGRELSNA